MKKDLPNDNLDKFLKNAFEGYSENPPEDLWNQIQGNIKPVASTKVVGFSKWAIAAAASGLIIIGALIGQHIYFDKKIAQIEQTIATQQKKMKEQTNDLLSPKNNKDLTAPALPKSNTLNNAPSFQNAPIKKSTVESDSRNGIGHTIPEIKFKKQVRLKKDESNLQQPIPPANDLSFIQNSEPTFVKRQNNQTAHESIIGNTTPVEKTNATNPRNSTPLGTDHFSLSGNDHSSKEEKKSASQLLTTLASKPTTLLPVNFKFNFSLTETSPPAITPLKKPTGGFSITAAVGVGRLKEQFKTTPPPPRRQRYLIAKNQNQKTYGTSWASGAQLKKQISNWQVVTGLLVRNEKFAHLNEFNIKFEEFRRDPNGREHQIDFELNAGSGIGKVEFRAKNATNEPIHNDDEIKISISSERTATFLSIPVSLGYQLKKGNWFGAAKGGGMINFLRKSNFEVTAEADHPRLNRRLTTRKRKDPKDFQKSTNLDGLIALSAGYEFSHRWSISLTPTYQFEITDRHQRPRIETNINSFNLNAGLNYRF